MVQKIPATIITGFLGSGKTTLIRHLLQNADGRRIALIINEFGDVGVDGESLRGCFDEDCAQGDITELSNGCICCTVADDFIPAMEAILARDPAPDHIVIETSGLALPQPLIRAFNWPDVIGRVSVDAVIALADSKAISEGQFGDRQAGAGRQSESEHETPLAELFEDQIACADMIILNKSDLLDAAQKTNLLADLKARARSGVQVLPAVKGALPVDIILGQNKEAESDLANRGEVHHHHHHDGDHHDGGDDHHDHDDHEHEDHHHSHDHSHDHGHDHHHDHGHDAFETFVLSFGELTDKDSFTTRLSDTLEGSDILRLKGFVAIKDKPMRLSVQAVGRRIECYFDKAYASGESRQSHLVVIGTAGLDRAKITKTLCP